AVNDAIINSGANDITLAVSAASEGIFGLEVLGITDADVTLTNAQLTGDDITIAANAVVTLSPDAIGGTVVRAAVAVATTDATVTIGGGSQLNAAGNVSIAAVSTVTASAEIKPDGSDETPSETTDAAVANITAVTGAGVVIEGAGTDLDAGGTLSVAATNTVTATTTADATSAGKGASVAVTTVTGGSSVAIRDGATASADAIALAATTTRTINTTAKSSPGGAAASGETGEDRNASEQVLDEQNAATSGGDISVAGAGAVSVVTSSTEAYVEDTGLLQATGTGGDGLKISAISEADVTTIADGTAVDPSAGSGVGVAVAINVATVDATAAVRGAVALDAADGVSLEAKIQDSTFTAEA